MAKVADIEISVGLDAGPQFLDRLTFKREGDHVHVGVVKDEGFYAYATFTAEDLLSIINTLGIRQTQD